MQLSKSERIAKKKLFKLMKVKRRKDQKRIADLLRVNGKTFKQAVKYYLLSRRCWWSRSPYISTTALWDYGGLRPLFHI